MERKIKLFLYVMGMLLVLSWVSFSTGWFLKNRQMTAAEKTSDNLEALNKNDVYYDIVFEPVGTLKQFKVMDYQGWVFTPTEGENANREVTLYFVRGWDRYKLTVVDPKQPREENSFIARPDVLMAFPDLPIPNDRVGIVGEFSAALMRDGAYDVYVYCKENEENYGLVKTQYRFEKKGDLINLIR